MENTIRYIVEDYWAHTPKFSYARSIFFKGKTDNLTERKVLTSVVSNITNL